MHQFQWDERKRVSNLQKHGPDFLDAVELFESPYLSWVAKMVDGER